LFLYTIDSGSVTLSTVFPHALLSI